MSSTPLRDVRRVPFSRRVSDASAQSRRISLRNSRLPPSPYTPFSGRRSGTLPPGTPQLEHSDRSSSISSAAAPFGTSTSSMENRHGNDRNNYSADEFIRTGMNSSLRIVTVNTLSALNRAKNIENQEEYLLNGIYDEVGTQIKLAENFCNKRSAHPHVRKELDNILEMLRLELNTWKLIKIAWRSSDFLDEDLTFKRLDPDGLDSIDIKNTPGIDKVHHITEWLESLASDSLDRSGGPNVKPLDDPAYRCGFTAQAKCVPAISMDYSLCEGPIDEIETKAEELICRELFKLIRAGRLDEAVEICRAAGQPWRAAILSGGKNCSSVAANGKKGDGRKVWRSIVGKITKSANNLPPYERALYAILAGVKEPALVVANDYESRAWVHFTTTLDNACQKAVLKTSTDHSGISDDQIIQMFDECDGAGEGYAKISPEIHAGIRKIRAYFSLGPTMEATHVCELLDALASLARHGGNEGLEWVVRLVSNLSLFLKLSGLMHFLLEDDQGMEDFEFAMAANTRLIVAKEKKEEASARAAGTIRDARSLVCELAAYQLSELNKPTHIVTEYAVLMVDSLEMDLRHERAERMRVGTPFREVDIRRTLCLEKAGACFNGETLDQLVLFVVDKVWDEHMPDMNYSSTGNNANGNEVTMSDEMVIRSIEFLGFPAFPNAQQAIVRATVAARRFFLLGKTASTARLVNWFPQNFLAQHSSQTNASNSEEERMNLLATREFDAWRSYMDAKNAYEEWQKYFYSNRPKSLPDEIRRAATADTGNVSYEIHSAARVQMDRYSSEVEEFNRTAYSLRETAVEALKYTLQFDGGWMLKVMEDSDGDGYNEVEKVRNLAVPELVWLLHRILHDSEEYAQAVELATTVAEDSTKLYECFNKTQIKALLNRIADSAILLADQTVKTGVERPYHGLFFEEFL